MIKASLIVISIESMCGESKAYRLFDPATKKIVISRDVSFEEDKGWNWGRTTEEVRQDELVWEGCDEDKAEESGNEEEAATETNNEDQEAVAPTINQEAPNEVLSAANRSRRASILTRLCIRRRSFRRRR
jgi:hypothetical protein